jgi:trypsin
MGGGTLINKRWILTAAHVANKSGLLLYAGVTNRQQLSFGQNRIYKQHKSHPEYGNNGSSTRPSNDIALIEVTTPFSGINSVQLASNSNAGLWNVTNQAQVSGFGNTVAGGTLSDNLLKVTVPITVVDNILNKIDAGANGFDSCQGDSGGPLLANPSGSNNKLQIGIVSSGGNCGTSIGVYTMVSKYLDFITQTLHLYGTPDIVCNNTTFENLEVLPDGVNFQWSATPSNLFSVTSTSGTTFTTSPQNGAYGKGKVTLTVTSPLGTYVHSKEVWVGVPPNGQIDITTDGSFGISNNSTTICKTFGYCMTPKFVSNQANVSLQLSSTSPVPPANGFGTPLISTVTNYSYSGWPSFNSFCNGCSGVAPNSQICFGTNNTGTYFTTVYASNSCGAIGRNIIVQVNSCGYRVYPNPAQKNIAVEFEDPDKVESIPDLIEIKDEKEQKVVKQKNIKDFKDKQKNTPYSKIDFDVSDLPRGVYYLSLKYGDKKGAKIETIKILLTE